MNESSLPLFFIVLYQLIQRLSVNKKGARLSSYSFSYIISKLAHQLTIPPHQNSLPLS